MILPFIVNLSQAHHVSVLLYMAESEGLIRAFPGAHPFGVALSAAKNASCIFIAPFGRCCYALSRSAVEPLIIPRVRIVG